jgi:hypothetical protein
MPVHSPQNLPKNEEGAALLMPKLLILLALPRGLRQLSPINGLHKSGTANRSTRSLGFLPRVSHRFKAASAARNSDSLLGI